MERADLNLTTIYSELSRLKSDFRNPNLFSFILSRAKGKTLLDIGCGVGHFINRAEEKGFDVYGIEPSKNLIALSKKLYKKSFDIKNIPAEKIDTFGKKVDTITMIDVLEHIEDDVLVLKKIKKLLKTNGRLIVLVPAYQALYGKRDKSIGHFRRYTAGELTQKLEKAGFNVLEKRYWNLMGIPPYFIYEKLLKKEVTMKARTVSKKGPLMLVNKLLNLWFKHVENNIHFGTGLSVMCVATPRTN